MGLVGAAMTPCSSTETQRSQTAIPWWGHRSSYDSCPASLTQWTTVFRCSQRKTAKVQVRAIETKNIMDSFGSVLKGLKWHRSHLVWCFISNLLRSDGWFPIPAVLLWLFQKKTSSFLRFLSHPNQRSFLSKDKVNLNFSSASPHSFNQSCILVVDGFFMLIKTFNPRYPCKLTVFYV